MDKIKIFVVFLVLEMIVEQSLSLPADICDGTAIVEVLPHPNDCTLYILCVNGVPTILNCGDNEIFNPDTKNCEPGFPEICEITTSATTLTEEPSTTSSTVTQELSTKTTVTPADTTTEILTTTRPQDSTTSEEPTTEEPTTMSDPTVTTTDEFIITTTNHETTTIEVTTTESTIKTTTEWSLPDDFCEGIIFEMLPHPNNCIQFILCMNEHPIINDCPFQSPVFYDGSCAEGDPTTCKIFTTTMEPITDPTTTTPIPDDYCAEIGTGFLPFPGNCTQFVLCMAGHPIINSCPDQNIFHIELCVPGDPTTCEVFTTMEPLITTTEPLTTTEQLTTTEPFITITEPLTTTEPFITTTEPFITTTEPLITTTEPLITTTEPLITTTEPFITTTEPFITTTKPFITTTKPLSTTTEPLTTTEPFTTTTEPLSTTTEPFSTTTEPEPEITTPSVTTESSTTTTQRPIGPPELCIGNNFKFIPDPDYCYRYYYCLFGIALPGECDPDKIFSVKWNGCILGDWDTCEAVNPFFS